MKYYYKSRHLFASDPLDGETPDKVYSDSEYEALYASCDEFHYIGHEGDELPHAIPFDDETCKSIGRRLRQKECFSVIDRSPLWYNSLTDEQRAELQTWYAAWLDVTQTLVIPTKPSWLK